ncbi:MAG: hypothetical protein ACRDX9_02030 [Acidimicrobiia bacterium]
MKVRMKVYISGTRNGEPWPWPGGEIVVGDVEGADLCRAGLAVPVADKNADVETRDDEKPKRGPGRPAGSRNKPKDE